MAKILTEAWDTAYTEMMDINEAVRWALVKEADKQAKHYYENFNTYDRREAYIDRGKLGLRVKDYNGTLTIIWETFFWSGPKGYRKRMAKALPKGRRRSDYDLMKFRGKGLKEWEWELLQHYEPELANIRHQALAAGGVKKALNLQYADSGQRKIWLDKMRPIWRERTAARKKAREEHNQEMRGNHTPIEEDEDDD